MRRLDENKKVETLTCRLEMSIFEGWNREGWVFRVECFFVAHSMSKGDKFAAATISLEGEVLVWFQWEEGRRSVQNWMEFKARFLDCFGQTQKGTLCGKVLALKQEGSVCEYLRLF